MYAPLSRLTTNDFFIMVRVTNMTLNIGQFNRSEIRGNFTADSVNNSIKDIQNCLSNPFNVSFLLQYNDRLYDLYITGMKWGVDPLQDEEEETFGHFLQYHCTFVANPHGASTPDPNVIIWDIGNTNHSERDLKELIGDDLNSLGKQAILLIEKYRNYRATIDCPTPSYLDDAGIADDVAAVLAGRKPAAIFDESSLSRETILPLLLQEAYVRGMQVETVEHFGTKHSRTRSIVVGIPYHVKQIVQIVIQAVRDNEVSSYYYERLGELIGMPQENIHQLIENMRDFGFNRA